MDSLALAPVIGIDWGVFEGGVEARLRLPYGFRVVEIPGAPRRASGWATFLMRKVGLSTIHAAYRALKVLGARRFSVAGLKDAYSVAFQYVSFKNPSTIEGYLEPDPRVRLWLVRAGSRVYPGLHRGNSFKITLESAAPSRVCSLIESKRWVPGFYGPQRFGVERPNSHLYGYYYARGLLGELLGEYTYRYPLEHRGCPGDYEARFVKASRDSRTPFASGRPPSIALEALQAYVFNRALSLALERHGDARRVAEGSVAVGAVGRGYRVPAARLPHESLSRSRSAWSRLVLEVLEEEGIDPRVLGGALRPRLRPLSYPVVSPKCRHSPFRGEAVARFILPPGAFATILLMAVSRLEWEVEA